MTGEDSAPQSIPNRQSVEKTGLPKAEESARHAPPRLLTLPQAARLLQVHPNTLKQQRRRGKLAVIRIGRRVLIDPSDLARYIESQREFACGRKDSSNTEITGSSNAAILHISPFTGADRERDGSDAIARARAISKQPSEN